MTRKEAKELLPIIEAFANGEKIECISSGKWEEQGDELMFNHEPRKYRIKPRYQPKFKETVYVSPDNKTWVKGIFLECIDDVYYIATLYDSNSPMYIHDDDKRTVIVSKGKYVKPIE